MALSLLANLRNPIEVLLHCYPLVSVIVAHSPAQLGNLRNNYLGEKPIFLSLLSIKLISMVTDPRTKESYTRDSQLISKVCLRAK